MDLQENITRRFGLDTDVGERSEGNKTLDVMFEHKSSREFRDVKISEDLMQTLLRAAFSAPSKSDLQQGRAIWIRDSDIKGAIAELSPSLQSWISKAPEFVVWCGDNSLSHMLAEKHGRSYVNNHLDQFMNPAVDAAIAMTTFIWAAESKGLGCCPVSSIRNTPRELSAILKLPQYVFPVAGLVVGYPKKDSDNDLSLRLPPSVSIMEDRYRDDPEAILNEVEEYSKRRQAQQPIPTEEQRGIEMFGVSEDYGWSEDKARQYALPERTDWGDFIRSQGFKLD